MSTKRFVARFGLDNNNETITNVGTPQNSSDAVTKGITDVIAANTVYLQGALTQANSDIVTANTRLKFYVDDKVSYISGIDSQQNSRILTVENDTVYLHGALNTTNSNLAFANTWLQSNDATTLSLSKSYTDSSNTSLKSYSDNTFLAKSGGTITGAVSINSNLQVTGNLTVVGNVTTISANNLSVKDNMIYLNEGATGNVNPDLGFSGAYNDGIYHHAGFFRDHSSGIWKVYDNYAPEPDASPYIDQSNASFRIASFQANVGYFNEIQTTSNVAIQGTLNVYSNTAIGVPTGNTTQRPTGSYGLLRYNADTGSFEGYTASGWGSIGGAIYMANTAPSNPQNGSTWWHTDFGKLLIYYSDPDGSQWVDASPDQAGLLAKPVRQSFIAVAGQTSFTVTGGYTPGLVDVFLNGVKLVNGTDVNVSTGTYVILSSGALVGSTLEVVGLNSASLTNVVATTGGTMTGDLQVPNLTYTGTLTGSANVVNIGSGQIYKDTSGNVGIGTTSPGDKLSISSGRIRLDQDYQIVWQNSGTNRARIYGDSGNNFIFETGSSNTERMRIDSSGNVGIGTSSPVSQLNVNASTGGDFRLTRTSVGGGSSTLGSVSFGNQSSSSLSSILATEGGTTTSSILAFYTATGGTSAERMRIDSSGNVGIGTTSPSSMLTLGAGGVARFYRGDNARYGSVYADNNGLNVVSNSAGDFLYLTAAAASSGIILSTVNTERVRIDSTGTLILSQGQIKFPATQNPSSDANTLDDYEEGTWTPIVRGAGTAGTYTLGTYFATYVKIGRVVTLNCSLTAFSAASGGTGYAQITNLPFTKTGNQYEGSVRLNYVTLDANCKYVTVEFVSVGSDTSTLYLTETVGNGAAIDLPISAITTSSAINIAITYLTAT